MERQALNRWIMVGIGFLNELVLGLLYAWSVFVLPLENEFGWIRAQTSLAFTVSLIFFPAGMIVGGRLTDKYGIRVTGSASAVLLTIGFMLTSLTSSIPWLVISYGVVAGFAIGIGTNTLANLLSWFPDRRGLAAGALTMGFGLAGLVLGSLTNWIIQATGWRVAFRILAAITFAVCVGGFQFLHKAPKGWKPVRCTQPAIKVPYLTTKDYRPSEMLRANTFWLIELWFLLISTAGVMMIGHIVPMAVDAGVTPANAVLAMGTLSLANGVGRLMYGTLSDRLGRAPTMFIGALFMSIAVFAALPLTKTMGHIGLILAVVFIGSSYGGGIPQASAMIMQLFGTKHFGTNYGISSSQIAVGGLLGPQMAAFLHTSTGAYDIPFTITGVLALLGCVLAALFGLQLRKEVKAAGNPAF